MNGEMQETSGNGRPQETEHGFGHDQLDSDGDTRQLPLEAFAQLKHRVETMVNSLVDVRQENERLQEELSSTRELLRLAQDELSSLQAERREVCERIDLLMQSVAQSGVDEVVA